MLKGTLSWDFQHLFHFVKKLFMGTLYSRVEWFWRKKMLHIVCCAKLLLDPNSKISCLNVASFLGRKAFENLDCYPKSTTKIIKKHFWKLRQGRTMSLICLKAKNEVNFKKNYFDLVQIKISFAHFWKIKMNIKQIFVFKFSFCRLFFDVSGRCLQVFQKILIFKVPMIFWKWKLCGACDALPRGRNCRFFGIEFLKIYLISRNV